MIEQKINLYPVSPESIFVFLILKDSNFYLKNIGRWFRSNDQTKFKYIIDKNLTKTFVSSDTVKELYPLTKIIATVTNPWFRVFAEYKSVLPSNKTLSFDKFLNDLDTSKVPEQVSLLTSADYIFRNEFLEEDFEPFKKSLNLHHVPLDIEKNINFNIKKIYKPEQNKIIENLYKNDIRLYYKEL